MRFQSRLLQRRAASGVTLNKIYDVYMKPDGRVEGEGFSWSNLLLDFMEFVVSVPACKIVQLSNLPHQIVNRLRLFGLQVVEQLLDALMLAAFDFSALCWSQLGHRLLIISLPRFQKWHSEQRKRSKHF